MTIEFNFPSYINEFKGLSWLGWAEVAVGSNGLACAAGNIILRIKLSALRIG